MLALRLSWHDMESMCQVQILDDALYTSFRGIAFEKCMNLYL